MGPTVTRPVQDQLSAPREPTINPPFLEYNLLLFLNGLVLFYNLGCKSVQMRYAIVTIDEARWLNGKQIFFTD